MRVTIIGGRLQGVETTYLAKKAGWEVILIDKDPVVPAMGLADEFRQLTDYQAGKPVWCATLIVNGPDRSAAWNQRCSVLGRIKQELGISELRDCCPSSNSVYPNQGVGSFDDTA